MDLASLLASALGGLTGGAAPQGAYAHQGSGSDWLMPDRLLPQGAGQPAAPGMALPPMRPPQAQIDATPQPPVSMPAIVGPPDALGPVAAAANALHPGQGIPNVALPPRRPTTVGLNILRGPFMG